MVIPHAPEARSTADYVAIVFVFTVAAMLLLFAAGVAVAAVLGYDVSTMASLLVDVVTTLTGALVGYGAGRGTRSR